MTEESVSYYWNNVHVLMKRRLNRKRSCRRKMWILQHDHDQQGACLYNNSIRELELCKVT